MLTQSFNCFHWCQTFCVVKPVKCVGFYADIKEKYEEKTTKYPLEILPKLTVQEIHCVWAHSARSKYWNTIKNLVCTHFYFPPKYFPDFWSLAAGLLHYLYQFGIVWVNYLTAHMSFVFRYLTYSNSEQSKDSLSTNWLDWLPDPQQDPDTTIWVQWKSNLVTSWNWGWKSLDTVFPRINARGVYFKIRDFRGAFIRGGRLFEGGVYFKISKIVETGYGRTKIRKHSCLVINVICTATC